MNELIYFKEKGDVSVAADVLPKSKTASKLHFSASTENLKSKLQVVFSEKALYCAKELTRDKDLM
jgi:hypothetical protein